MPSWLRPCRKTSFKAYPFALRICHPFAQTQMVAPDLHDNTPVLSETIAYKHWMDPAFAMHQGLSLLVIGQHTGPTHL